MRDIPLEQVKVVNRGGGVAAVVHRATGLELGTVRRLDRGAWESHAWGRRRPEVGQDESRAYAVEKLLEVDTHHPGHLVVVPRNRTAIVRPDEAIPEAQDRGMRPEEWARWDRVHELFEVRLPEGWRTDLPDGWVALLLPTVHASGRQRVALVRPDWSEFAPVWADRWEGALGEVRKGRPVPPEMQAPQYADDSVWCRCTGKRTISGNRCGDCGLRLGERT